MRATFAIAALVGSAIAAPSYGAGAPPKDVKYVEHVEVVTVVETVYVTEGYEAPVPTPTPEPVYQAPAVTTVVVDNKPSSKYEAPAYTPAPQPAYTPAPQPEQPKPTPTPTPAPAPAPVDNGYMGIVEEWRGKLGLSQLTYSSKLESNAMDTVVSSNGQMVHKLNPGSFAQVLAPGSADDFTHVFVGGWLCERPNLPGLNGVCATQSNGWSYEGQTGHADILVNTAYKSIGCALNAGIWCCDLA